tara:strand:- start:746 stop:1222 length:477 start_codon:yes stop_codon:yes gene_type:complete
MAIRDTSRKPYIQDNDNNIKIGIDLPVRRGDNLDGYFASTKTTIEAVKNNIRNLVSTVPGERFYHPTLGIHLRKFLFEQIDDNSILSIQDLILDSISVFLPFVEVRNIQVKTANNNTDVGVNTLLINIIFNIKRDPQTLDSVQLAISSTSDSTTDGGF